MGEPDYIQLKTEDAIKNFQFEKEKFVFKDHTIYGEYNFVPIPEEKKKDIESALNDIHVILTPTLKKLKHKGNLMEIQDRIYRKVLPWETEFNTCIMSATRLQDTHYCSDKFINQLRGDGQNFVKDILREY